MMGRQPREDDEKKERNQQSALSNMRKQWCKTGLLYKMVEHHDLISSFSKMTKVRKGLKRLAQGENGRQRQHTAVAFWF